MSFLPKIYIAGHRGMVGSAICRTLQQHGQANLVTRTHAELDLTHQGAARAHQRATSMPPNPTAAPASL